MTSTAVGKCALCSQDLDFLTIPDRELHYQQHFDQPSSSSSGQTKPRSVDTSKPKKNWKPKLFQENDTFWRSSQLEPPPANYTPGLIPLLRNALLKSHSRGDTRRAILCFAQTVHICREPWDAGWGCGYRNFLMLCAALMDQQQQPLYYPLLDAPLSPSIRNLQALIETAWKEGFDEEGAKDLKKLVGTRKWIGTADLWVAFSYQGIPVELVDFNLKNNPRGPEIVTNWVVEYFTPKTTSTERSNMYQTLKGASPVLVTDRMPIILQHNGHSRTIVGYEVDKRGVVNLITFDPGRVPSAQVRNAALSASLPATTPNGSGSLKRSASNSSSVGQSGNSSKRARSSADEDGSDIEIIHDSRDTHAEKPTEDKFSGKKKAQDNTNLFSTNGLLKKYRLDPKALGKNKQYQILYCPMTAPLTERERMGRKFVTSQKVS